MSRAVAGIVVIGLFVTAAAFSEQLGQALAGAIAFAAGVLAIVFRAELAELQHRIAETGAVSESWREARPFTWLLWGVGVALVGVIWVVSTYAHV